LSFGTQMHDNPAAGRQDFGDSGSSREAYGQS